MPTAPLYPPFERTAGPMVGVRDAVELSAQDMSRAAAMVNGYNQLPEIGTDTMQRAGFVQRTVPGTIAGESGDITGWEGPIYAMAGVITPAATKLNYLYLRRSTSNAQLNGDFWQGPGGGPSYFRLARWTAPSTYNVAQTGTAVLLVTDPSTTSGRIFLTPFAGYLVVTQTGSTRPHKADMTTPFAVSVLSDLTVGVYGRPTVYYGKLFFILNSDRSTIVWSEENDADIGYQAAGYDNFWTLRQTSNAAIVALAGTNQFLYVFRENSITSVEGAVNSDFRAAGTLEGISTSVGTLAPDSVVLVEDAVWFLDQFCRPQAILPGRGLVPLWPNAAKQCALADVTGTVQYGNWGRYIPETEIVVFRVAQASGNPVLMVYSSRTQEYLGTWSLLNYTSVDFGGILFDSDGRSMLAITPNTGVLPLNFATQKANTATDQRDELASTATPTFSVTSPRIQGDVDMQLNVKSVTVSGQRLSGAQAPIKLQWQGSSVASTTAVTMNQAAVTNSGDPARATYDVNMNQTRWVQLVASNDITDANRCVIGQMRVIGTQQRIDPALP